MQPDRRDLQVLLVRQVLPDLMGLRDRRDLQVELDLPDLREQMVATEQQDQRDLPLDSVRLPPLLDQ